MALPPFHHYPWGLRLIGSEVDPCWGTCIICSGGMLCAGGSEYSDACHCGASHSHARFALEVGHPQASPLDLCRNWWLAGGGRWQGLCGGEWHSHHLPGCPLAAQTLAASAVACYSGWNIGVGQCHLWRYWWLRLEGSQTTGNRWCRSHGRRDLSWDSGRRERDSMWLWHLVVVGWNVQTEQGRRAAPAESPEIASLRLSHSAPVPFLPRLGHGALQLILLRGAGYPGWFLHASGAVAAKHWAAWGEPSPSVQAPPRACLHSAPGWLDRGNLNDHGVPDLIRWHQFFFVPKSLNQPPTFPLVPPIWDGSVCVILEAIVLSVPEPIPRSWQWERPHPLSSAACTVACPSAARSTEMFCCWSHRFPRRTSGLVPWIFMGCLDLLSRWFFNFPTCSSTIWGIFGESTGTCFVFFVAPLAQIQGCASKSTASRSCLCKALAFPVRLARSRGSLSAFTPEWKRTMHPLCRGNLRSFHWMLCLKWRRRTSRFGAVQMCKADRVDAPVIAKNLLLLLVQCKKIHYLCHGVS